MSGPALRHLDSHHAIHEAARMEAVGLTTLIDRALTRKDDNLVMELSHVLIEHWETRTLCHAQAEEDGLYREIAQLDDSKQSTVSALARDHELMRMVVQDVKDLLLKPGPMVEVSQRFHFLLWLEQRHSLDEEQRLIAPMTKQLGRDDVPGTAS